MYVTFEFKKVFALKQISTSSGNVTQSLLSGVENVKKEHYSSFARKGSSFDTHLFPYKQKITFTF